MISICRLLFYHKFDFIQVKVALRSVLNELDEETEILPHIKMSKDFEIYEPVTLQPLFTILPWDENTKPSYDVFFKVRYMIIQFLTFGKTFKPTQHFFR